MGVIYKLKDEVRDFILGEKKVNPHLSCRSLEQHVEGKFNIKLSKSSINALIKEAGLSAPIGRRPKKKKQHIAMPVLPILLESKPEIQKLEQKEPKVEIENKVRIDEEKLAKEAIEKEKARQLEEERIRQEEAEQKAKQEAALKLEKEKWERLAREEAERKPQEGVAEPEPRPEIQNSGIVLLEAADYLIGGRRKIAELIQSKPDKQDKDSLVKIKNLLYSPMLPSDQQGSALELARTVGLDILNLLNSSLQEVRCIKILLSVGNAIYLDGQFYSVWSTPHIPYDFSTTIYNIKGYLNSLFYENRPLVIFNAPGYDMPSQEFFRLILSLEGIAGKITKLTLYGNKLEELEDFNLPSPKKHSFIFGLWPWQFVEYRKVNKIGEFKHLRLGYLKKDFYAADIEIVISQPNITEKITLRGVVLKANLSEKTRLVILTNLPVELMGTEVLSSVYLSHWPNLEEAFGDYSHKIELFTYTANSQRFFSQEALGFEMPNSAEIKSILGNYLKDLDLYVKWHFLPPGYEDKDFLVTKERFYDLRVDIDEAPAGFLRVIFQVPGGYAYLKDLEYMCRRLNEREIKKGAGLRAYFAIG